MAELGVRVYELATEVSTPRVAAVSIPFVVGTAPVNRAEKPVAAMRPVLCTSWAEAVKQLGYSDDWKRYTLCEAMYSHFKLFGMQPVIFLNVLDPAAMRKDVEAAALAVSRHRAQIDAGAIPSSVTVKDGEDTLEAEVDYILLYEDESCAVELLEGGSHYEASMLTVSYAAADPEAVDEDDIVEGLDQVDRCMTVVGMTPDLILAPGWSHLTTVAAVMATKADNVSGLFGGKALVDIPCREDGVTDYTGLSAWKNEKNLVDPNQIACWPLGTMGDRRFHLSVQLAGLMAEVDSGNKGIPYESPSNKNLKIDGCCLEDGTEVSLTWPQVNLIAGSWGVVTAVNFMDTGWVAKGNYTACYPGNTDVKDQFIPVSRMFDFIRNTLIRTFWPKLDKPMNTALVRSLVTTCNTWLNGLTGGGYLNGARVEVLADDNSVDKILDGIITLRIYNAPPVPAQEIDFLLCFDPSYMENALSI